MTIKIAEKNDRLADVMSQPVFESFGRALWLISVTCFPLPCNVLSRADSVILNRKE